MIPHHGKANQPNKKRFISIGACMKGAKNGEALDLLADTVLNGFALSIYVMIIKLSNNSNDFSVFY
jgi:hypothetical protein